MTAEGRGRWYDELTEGQVFAHRPHRTVLDSDNVLFSTLTMNAASIHLDHEHARESEFGRPLVNSLFTLSTIVGLSVHELTDRTTVANLGFAEVSFPNPVFAGDTLRSETLVVEKRLSRSRPGQGIVLFEHRGTNQRDEVVCVARRQALMWRAPELRDAPAG